jgi:hypothetical protein
LVEIDRRNVLRFGSGIDDFHPHRTIAREIAGFPRA